MELIALRKCLADLGAKPVHERLLLRSWLGGRPLNEYVGHPKTDYPRALREALPFLEKLRNGLVRLRKKRPSSDGTCSMGLVYELQDGRMVETVWLPRGTVCVSTQVGCAVGCLFCQTGKGGLERNLQSLEICAQVVDARREGQPCKRVVLMGMGEALHNLPAVLEAIDLLGGPGFFPHKQITLSTVGSVNLFSRLLEQRVRPSVALSLHSLDPKTRSWLLPKAPEDPPLALIEAADDYARSSGWPIQYQWTLIKGVNDREEDLQHLAQALAKRKGILNLIPMNPVEGSPFEAPEDAACVAFVRRLKRAGVYSSIRKSAGSDVKAACGQLRGKLATS